MPLNYSCPKISPVALPCPNHTPTPSFNPQPVGHYRGSFIHVPWLQASFSFPWSSPFPPFCSLTVCSLLPCLRFYFARLFVSKSSVDQRESPHGTGKGCILCSSPSARGHSAQTSCCMHVNAAGYLWSKGDELRRKLRSHRVGTLRSVSGSHSPFC